MAINYFAQAQQQVNSFNNSALFVGRHGAKATKQSLVPVLAQAKTQLQSELQKAVGRKQFEYAQRVCDDLVALKVIIDELELRRDVSYAQAQAVTRRR